MSWVKKNNPWGTESVYKTRDMNVWIDRVMLEYRKISHRIFSEGELSQEEREAILNTMGAFESSIAHYQAAVELTTEQPLAVFTLVRQSLASHDGVERPSTWGASSSSAKRHGFAAPHGV